MTSQNRPIFGGNLQVFSFLKIYLFHWLFILFCTARKIKSVMASVIWDAHKVISIDYLEKGRTITGSYYSALWDRLVDAIRKKRPHLKKKIILFHDDNAPSHTPNIAQAKKHELGSESLPRPAYSPDQAPSDYYLFPNLKRWLCGRRFKTNEEVEWETKGYFGVFDKSYYLEGIKKLKDRWSRFELKGTNIEK